MNDRRLYILIGLGVFIIGGTAVGINVWGVVGLATIGTAVTMGLRTGSFEPMFPGLSRAERPVAFWLVVTWFSIMLLAVGVALALRLFLRR